MKDARKTMPGRERLCKECDQPMLPKGATKLPNEYDHAQGCPMAVTGALKASLLVSDGIMAEREKVVFLAKTLMGWVNFGNGISATYHLWNRWNPYRSIADARDMEAKIPEAKRGEYVRHLCDAVTQAEDNDPRTALWNVIRATPAQKCDAAVAAMEGK